MRSRLAVAIVFVAHALSSHAWAQTENRITGVVRDASGAGIPGATVTVTNQTTKDSKTATTGNDGSYSVSVTPGRHSVAASGAGFRRTAHDVDIAAGDFCVGRGNGRAEVPRARCCRGGTAEMQPV
jgi:hypothetical protein